MRNMHRSAIIILLFSLFTAASTIVQGSVHVVDNRLERKVAVPYVQIELESAGKKYYAYTNESGMFSFPKGTPQGKMKLNWQHKGKYFYLTDDRKNTASISGPKGKSAWHLTIPQNGKQHFYATVFRAASAYITSDFVNGYDLFRDTKINVHYRTKKFGGSGKARYNALTKEVYFWGINRNNDKPYDDIRLFGFVAHEMAHVHHDHFFKGKSQHLDTEDRLRESWAEAVKYFLVLDEYNEQKFREFKTYSKQIPFHSGWHNHDWGRSKKYYSVYTPLMIDLVDDFNQKQVDDRVSGYTMKQILDVMKEKECTDFASFKKLLKTRYDNPTEQYLDILFREMEEKK